MSGSVAGEPMLERSSRAHRDHIGNAGSVDVETLFRQHRERLTRLATAIVFDRVRAEDVVQDAFAGLHRRADDVRNAEAYLQRSVVNLSIRALRRRHTADRYQPDPPPVSGIPEIDETWSVVGRLPGRQRAVVALKFWEDLSEADIAATLDWPVGTVKSTLHRALKQLEKELAS